MPALYYEETRYYKFDFTSYLPRMKEDGVDVEDGEEVMAWLDENTDHYFISDDYFQAESSETNPYVKQTEEEEGLNIRPNSEH